MERTYDIFEIGSKGEIWRASVSGLEAAINRMRELASESTNGFRIMHLPTKTVVAILNAKESPSMPASKEREALSPEKHESDLFWRHMGRRRFLHGRIPWFKSARQRMDPR